MKTETIDYIYPLSSFIHRIFRFSNGTTEITFNNRSVYTYYNVPRDVFNGLVNADSAGKYFNKNRRYFSNFVRSEN